MSETWGAAKRLTLRLGLALLAALLGLLCAGLALRQPAVARILGDELLGHLAGLRIGALVVRRLHQVARRAVELARDPVVEGQLHDPNGVDDDAGRVRGVPNLELQLEVERHVTEASAL